MSLKRCKRFSFIRAQHYCVTHSNTRDTKQRRLRTKRREQVTLPYVSHSRCGVAEGCSWWTGWSWRPCTSPSARLLLHRQPKDAWGQTAECCSARAHRGPELGWTSGGWGPWRRGCGWAGTSPSPPAGKRRPGASSRAWAAPRWSWERRGSPTPPPGLETSLDSDKEQKTRNGSFNFLVIIVFFVQVICNVYVHLVFFFFFLSTWTADWIILILKVFILVLTSDYLYIILCLYYCTFSLRRKVWFVLMLIWVSFVAFGVCVPFGVFHFHGFDSILGLLVVDISCWRLWNLTKKLFLLYTYSLYIHIYTHTHSYTYIYITEALQNFTCQAVQDLNCSLSTGGLHIWHTVHKLQK